MAKRKVNRSQKIRDFKAENPDAGPKEIQEGLKKQKVTVSSSLISQVLYRKPKKKRATKKRAAATATKKRPAKRGRKAKQAATDLSVDSLLAAKAYADKCGSIEQAQEALGTLEKVRDILG